MEFSDQDLRLVMNRALRSVLVAIAVGIPILWVAWGWRSAVLYLVAQPHLEITRVTDPGGGLRPGHPLCLCTKAIK